jgi:hypothetical protein
MGGKAAALLPIECELSACILQPPLACNVNRVWNMAAVVVKPSMWSRRCQIGGRFLKVCQAKSSRLLYIMSSQLLGDKFCVLCQMAF